VGAKRLPEAAHCVYRDRCNSTATHRKYVAVQHYSYSGRCSGDLPPDAHYFVREIGYLPTHNAEAFYREKMTDG
jgi:hypothetical protein